jgi:hypothetical protein
MTVTTPAIEGARERGGPTMGGNEVVDGRWVKLKGRTKAERRLETKGKPTSDQSSWHKEDKVCAVGGPSLTICCSPYTWHILDPFCIYSCFS